MFKEPEDFDFTGDVEKADLMVGVLREAMGQLTRRQLECAVLLLLDLTQEQAGAVLGVSQQMVSVHFAAVLKKMERISAGIL